MTGVRLPPRRNARRSALLAAITCVALWLAAFADPLAHADTRKNQDFLIVVHPANPWNELDSDLIAEVFLKKTTRWGNGETMRPVDLPPNSWVRRRFTETVLKRSVAAVRSYWQQRIFTGRDVPPPELESDEAVLRYVSKYAGAIGYVGPNTKVGGVKVLPLRVK